LVQWAKKNPIKAGIATFLPVMLGAGLVRGAKALGLHFNFGPLGKVAGKLEKGMGGGPGAAAAKAAEKKAEKKAWGYGLDHFVGFGGTKGGPLDGAMKVLQMYL
jgi:hypothetical protein